MNSHQSLQTLFSNVIQAILTKIALDYKLSLSELTNKISTPTITDDLEGSILSYCNSLAAPIQTQSIPEKTKKIVKKKTVPAIADAIAGSLRKVPPSQRTTVHGPFCTGKKTPGGAGTHTVLCRSHVCEV